MKITTQINAPKISGKITNNDGLWLFAASTWHKLYSPYVPMQTGNLMSNVTITPGSIKHNVPYASRCYHARYHFRTNKHPYATGKWDEVAKVTQYHKLVRSINSYIASGRL